MLVPLLQVTIATGQIAAAVSDTYSACVVCRGLTLSVVRGVKKSQDHTQNSVKIFFIILCLLITVTSSSYYSHNKTSEEPLSGRQITHLITSYQHYGASLIKLSEILVYLLYVFRYKKFV